VILRNYEGVITSYQEPNHYEATICDRDCENCKLELDTKGSDEINAIGIEKLLSDYDDTISLIPSDNDRLERRERYSDEK
jgi:lysine 2,3-aminomutase